MLICKQGFSHKEEDINNQDVGSVIGRYSIVTDGCSGTPDPEVGAKLFHYFLHNQLSFRNELTVPFKIELAFTDLAMIMPRPEMLGKFCFFTIIVMEERASEYQVWWQGDGNIITINKDNVLEFHPIEKVRNENDEEEPPYFVYGYLPNEYVTKEHELGILTRIFPKSEYPKVGIASDGIDYIRLTDFYSRRKEKNNRPHHPMRIQMKQEFESLLLQGKDGKIEQLIRRANRDLEPSDKWKDDITIIM